MIGCHSYSQQRSTIIVYGTSYVTGDTSYYCNFYDEERWEAHQQALLALRKPKLPPQRAAVDPWLPIATNKIQSPPWPTMLKRFRGNV